MEQIEEHGQEIDLVLLDVSLQDGNGFAVCAAVKANTEIPVIFLTASGDEYSTVTGLDMGADDYISKPFRPRELISRMKGVLRRCGRTQYRLLLIFINNKGIVLTRNKLLEEIWDAAGEYVNDNTLTVYIKRLRQKIEDDPQEPVLIRTVRGMGYRA